MQYLMFVCVDEALATPEATKDMGRETVAWVEEMDGRGVRLQGNRLQEISTATTVRVRGGEVVLADGPFAETKELIAGYDLLECADDRWPRTARSTAYGVSGVERSCWSRREG